MSIGLTSVVLAGAAGMLSTLSPCVLSLLPILLAGAQASHRAGPLALSIGLASGFTGMGVLVVALGGTLGVDADHVRLIAAIVLILFGATLLSPRLQRGFSRLTQGVGTLGQQVLQRVPGRGWAGQFILGLTLGMVWTPCVGPTLGAAITLASQGSNLFEVSVVMAAFGLGTSLPLLALGLASRTLAQRMRGRLANTGRIGKPLLGAMLLAMGLLVLSGLDKRLEALLLNMSPDWLTNLTTSF